MNVLAIGDSFMPSRYFERAFRGLAQYHTVSYRDVDPALGFEPSTSSELRLREYEGAPAEIAAWMPGVEVLVVHGAPVSVSVLDASPKLKLVCCARGGPVNIDVEAVSARELPLVTTPGKNAAAVADLTLAFLVMLARGIPTAQRFIADGNELLNNYDGARFIGSDLRRHVLGLVGFGAVGKEVAARAVPFGLSVLAFDPFVQIADPTVTQVETLQELLEHADFVSLHARATPENTNMIDAVALRRMKPRAFLINTARETLVDEDALDAALGARRLGGVALDVVRPNVAGRLLHHENVVITPHLGGATRETLLQGAEMIADEVRRFAKGEELIHLANRTAVRST
jgi:D-3-phosphoglycerate dehydrogenase / 2-oxoglutarate reductase